MLIFLYRLKKILRAWNKRINIFFIKPCLNKGTSKHAVYVKGLSEPNQVILYVYMDDLLVRGSNKDELEKFKSSMENEFEMSYIRKLAYFLGMEIVNTRHGVFLHQKKYAEDNLKKFKMRN